MTYFDFRRLEALIAFKNKQIKEKPIREKQDKVKQQISGLAPKSVSNMGFSKEQLDAMFN